MKKILFTGDTLSDGQRLELKNAGFEIVPASYDLSGREVARLLNDCDGYILGGDEIADSKMIESAGNKLKVISFFGAGYEKYIDVKAATKRGIKVANTPGANANSVAEFTVALMCSIVKDIVSNTIATKAGDWSRPKTFDLNGKTIGIVGMGNIGKKVAQILSCGFGAKIVYTSRKSKFDVEEMCDARKVSLDELCKVSDIISIHASLTDETRDMISTSQFEKMKDGVVIINSARVEIINEGALVEAIKKGKVAKCAFDGFYEEPVTKEVVETHELIKLPNNQFIVTPHMAYYTSDALAKMEKMAIDNVLQVLSGQICHNVVN